MTIRPIHDILKYIELEVFVVMLDLINERFNYLVVKSLHHRVKGKGAYWLCQCDCGNETIVIGQSLRNNHTQSCGCLGRFRAMQNIENSRGCRFENLDGFTSGKLSVTPIFEKRGRNYYWLCKCECGNEAWVSAKHLKDKSTQSCGCLAKEVSSMTHKTHGMSKTRFYKIWSGLFDRCYRKSHVNYKNYGGRGIKICDRWHKFENFKEDMYESYLKHCDTYTEYQTTIDRIDNNGNYEPSNCRWATRSEQQKNRRKYRGNQLDCE